MAKRFIAVVATVVVLGLVAVVAALLAGTRAADSTPNDTRAAGLPVDVVTVTPQDHYVISRQFTGEIRPRRAANLSFRLPGTLLVALVEEGARVEAGDVLARLDLRRLEAEKRELEARKAQAVAMLDELIEGPRAEEIRGAQARVEDVKHGLSLSRINRERAEKLLAGDAGSLEDVDAAITEENRLTAQLEREREALAELLKGTRSERIRAQQGQVDQHAAALEALIVDLDESEMRAPFAGRISKRHLDEGSVVAPGEPVFRLVEDSALEAWVGVPLESVSGLNETDTYKFEAAKRAYTGRLQAVSPEIDEASRTVTAIFRLDEAEMLPMPGETVRMEIERRVEEDGYWLPATALTRGMRGLWACYAVVADDESPQRHAAEPRQIEVLYSDGQRLFVRGSIAPGERIVASGTDKLVGGQRVDPLTDATEG